MLRLLRITIAESSD